MSSQPEPDVAFGTTRDFGIAAAVADDRPFLDEVLRKHHFAFEARLNVYLLPPETAYDVTVKNMAAATREFQAAGLSVAADPRAVVPPHPDGPAHAPAHSEAAGSDPQEGRRGDHAARSHAARAASPQRPAPTQKPAPPSPRAAPQPPTGNRRTR
ncbi:hypothetical protein [Streptomyces sp. NPDC048172]|uniref:hypothetical protein n=1 Tax=Streptomyces sp. NPDC048172 TaxID=3365505 RepID=UPI003716B5B6